MISSFSQLLEQKGSVVFTFGRFNPPTTGHEKLIQKVAAVAGSNPFRIYPSQSQNQKKDPLPFALKVAYMRKMFPKYARNIIADRNLKTALDIAVKLHDEGFKNLMMVVGSDRVKRVFIITQNHTMVLKVKDMGFMILIQLKLHLLEIVTQMQRVFLVCLHQR